MRTRQFLRQHNLTNRSKKFILLTYIKYTLRYELIGYAFEWDDTKEGDEYWRNLCFKWNGEMWY